MDVELQALLRELQIEAPEAYANFKTYIDALRQNPTDPVLITTVPLLILNWMRAFRPDLAGLIFRLTAWLARLSATIGGGATATGSGAAAAGGGVSAGAVALAGLGALAAALLVIGGGVALPASKWGALEFDNPFTAAERRRTAEAKLRDRLAAHRRLRDKFRQKPSWTGLRELLNDAESLRRELREFIAWWAGSAEAEGLTAALAELEEWIEEYVIGGLPAPPVVLVTPVPAPVPPRPVAPPPAGPLPPTIAAPPSLEWLEGEHIRRMIKFWRDRIRTLKARLRESEEWERDYRKELQRVIDEALVELEKLRAQAEALGQDTGEEWDEPLDPPSRPPTPDWPLGHDWQHPQQLYVDPETGKQGFFSDPPPGWQPAVGPDLKPHFRWGWVLRLDPETLKPQWVPGWVPLD